MKEEPGMQGQNYELEKDVLFNEYMKKPEVSEALAILDQLPENLSYHNKAHTLDVIKETILFALVDGVEKEILDQLVIAAAWHDVGYIEQYEHNEPVAVRLFENSSAYTSLPDDIRQEIVANILDTQLVIKDGEPFLIQSRSKLGYLLDADVSNFGREDFWEKRLLIAQELGIDLNDLEIKKMFYSFALRLLKNQEWKTAPARMLRQTQKERNLVRVAEELEALVDI